MKRRDLLAELEKAGCILLRNGARHDIYHNPATGRSQPVPHHREINELLAKEILKDLTAGEKDFVPSMGFHPLAFRGLTGRRIPPLLPPP